MKDLFLKRKQTFRKECVGYLRYVLNDHFVLFLLVLVGFLAYQYSQLHIDIVKTSTTVTKGLTKLINRPLCQDLSMVQNHKAITHLLS